MKKKLAKKSKIFSVDQIFAFVIGFIGAAILVWISVKMSNPFPFALPIGIALVILSFLVTIVFDKAKWSKSDKKHVKGTSSIGFYNGSGNGGSDGGSGGD